MTLEPLPNAVKLVIVHTAGGGWGGAGPDHEDFRAGVLPKGRFTWPTHRTSNGTKSEGWESDSLFNSHPAFLISQPTKGFSDQCKHFLNSKGTELPLPARGDLPTVLVSLAEKRSNYGH